MKRITAGTSLSNRGNTHTTSAFTIIELLITVSIIVILLSILLPALKPARLKVDLTRDLATQRQLLLALDLYASDARDFFPYFATCGDPTGAIHVRDFDFAQLHMQYFSAQSVFWLSVVVPKYLSPDIRKEFIQVGEFLNWPDYIIPTQFFLTYGAFAAPPYWIGDKPPENVGLLHGMRTDQVRFPSGKTLVLQMMGEGDVMLGPERDVH